LVTTTSDEPTADAKNAPRGIAAVPPVPLPAELLGTVKVEAPVTVADRATPSASDPLPVMITGFPVANECGSIVVTVKVLPFDIHVAMSWPGPGATGPIATVDVSSGTRLCPVPFAATLPVTESTEAMGNVCQLVPSYASTLATAA
jgi:hypothetical protein